jgi:hypothetical protein
MKVHSHISPIHGLAVIALVIVVFGTVHLLALTHDNRFSRAWVSLGF